MGEGTRETGRRHEVALRVEAARVLLGYMIRRETPPRVALAGLSVLLRGAVTSIARRR